MEPRIRVGILSSPQVTIEFPPNYGKAAFEGMQTFAIKDHQILWNGQLFDGISIKPAVPNTPFVIKDVVIGIGFHWERKEDQEFQGTVQLIVDNNRIQVLNNIGIEDYLTSVISSEMSATASLNLLKAHAVISRSWLLAQIEKNKHLVGSLEKYTTFTETDQERIKWYDREDHTHFDVCADDHCQRYQGITRAFSNIEMVRKAVSSTRGEVLQSDNKICDARFYKCCGGALEEFQNCWEDIRYPYLRKLQDGRDPDNLPDLTEEAAAIQWITSRPSAFCDTQDKEILQQVLNNYDQETPDFYRWQVVYQQDDLSDLIRRRSGIDFGQIQYLIPIQRGTSARLIKLKVVGSKRTMIIGKELEIRRILSESHLYSAAFIVEKKGDQFILTGAGWGHGVGLCQIGAAVMGTQGYDYKQILAHYYPGSELKRAY